MKKLLVVIFSAALIFSAGCQTNKTETNAQSVETPVPKNTIDTFGIVKATNIKDIILDFPASIKDIHVSEGQRVKNGDPLFTIDYQEYKNQIDEKNIQLQSLKQEYQNNNLELKNLESELQKLQNYLRDESHPDLKILRTDLKSAEKIYSSSLEDLKSKQLLHQKGTLSQDELNTYIKTVDTFEKSVSDIKLSIEKTRYSLDKEASGLKLQIAQKSDSIGNSNGSSIYGQKITALENTIKLMKDKVNKSYINKNDIISDMDNAIIYNLSPVRGEVVNSSQKIFSLLDVDSIIIEADIPEEFIKDIKNGVDVTITPQADKSKKYPGKITYIASTAVQKNGETTVLVQTSVDNSDGFLLPNFNVNLEINLD